MCDQNPSHIPTELYSDATGKPFEHCSACNEPLTNRRYFVEKVYQINPKNNQHFVLFEYAICEQCRQQMAEEISEESMQNIQKLMESYSSEPIVIPASDSTIPTQCTFTGKPLSDMEEYHIVAMADNTRLLMPPMAFGAEMIESYQEVLSEKTKDFLNDFFDQFIDIPPALAKILNRDKTPVFI